ncbi:hypothetical protein [Mesorhizobium sp. IMUNJ 23232]|uniref:hypothetical protein n=1 Tax=Mesorhizobium sp. IMUNJ 23232 TaxID=3376064 RepID=UPI0037BBC1E4
MSEYPYPSDWDLAWLASDRSNYLAAFITAGSGPIPISLLPQLNRYEASENLEYLMLQLPIVSEACLLVTVPTPDSYIELARRGLYVFDLNDVHRTTAYSYAYEAVAAPTFPIRATSLSGKLARTASEQNLAKVRFDENRLIDISSYLDCSSS